MALAIYINAGNSTSGNPKRGWIIADDGYANLPRTSRIDVAPSTYRDAYRQASGIKPSRRRR